MLLNSDKNMNGGSGGCSIARYGVGGGGCGMYGMSKVDKIMLKYRPIAPKPVTAGSGGSDNSDGYVKCGRSKRKYVRVKKNRNKKENNNSKKRKVTTLSLLPEIPDQKDNEPVLSGSSDLVSRVKPTKWLSFNNHEEKVCYGLDPVVMKSARQQAQPRPQPQPRKPQVVSYVTVEYVTDTWVDLQGLGCTDAERVKNMEMDTCPGFISDGQDRVIWTNKAYGQMAGVGQVFGGDEVAVVLIRKDKWATPVTALPYPTFTCKVRVTSAVQNAATSTSLTLPCDVWRMERGACAWRLDVKAALSLGR